MLLFGGIILKSMLSYYAKRSKGEGFSKTLAAREYTSWVHADNVSSDELAELVSRFGLAPNIVRDVRDDQELPRVEYGDKGYVYIFLRAPQINRRGEISTSPLLSIIRGKMFFSLGNKAAFQPSEITESEASRQTINSNQLALLTITAVVNEYENLIHRTAKSIHDIGSRLKTHEVTNDDFVYFVTIEDNLNECTTNLDGLRALALHLRENRRRVFSTSDEEAIDDILLHIKQLLVAVHSHRQSVASIRDAYRTIADNSLNQRMKTLTVLTVLIALPNVFYGMYGMNVKLPFAEHSWAYAGVVIFTVLLILVVYMLARRFKIF